MSVDHPIFKTGKLPAVQDKRNLLLAHVLRAVKTPTEYSIDGKFPGIVFQMLDNDRYGNCVTVEDANHVQHMKLVEGQAIPKVTAAEVDKEYFRQTKNKDVGLELQPSLEDFRKNGRHFGGALHKIKAYMQVQQKLQAEVQVGVYSDRGLKIGLQLPLSAQKEINAGNTWANTTGQGTIPGTWGGHCVYVQSYTKDLVGCLTWARIQWMTWKFFFKYCDESYTLVDDLESQKVKKMVDTKMVQAFLDSIK